MKTKNNKGFSLIMAIMIVTVLVIMAAGFFSVTDYSTKSVKQNTENLRLYWATESASNYNVAWWANQPDSIRKNWPNVYVLESKGSKATQEISDLAGTRVKETGFAGAEGTTEDGLLYMHPSTTYEGNAGQNENSELENHDGFKLITTRYKGSRKDFPDQAVWVLDSYAYNPETGGLSNICLANVYNFRTEAELEPFIHSELITSTMAGTGFHGVKGRFNEQDTRYGPAYYGDIVHFDYITGSSKVGPVFYGMVKSAAWSKEKEITGYDARSWYRQEGNKFKDASGDYFYGLGINSAKASNEAQGIAFAQSSLLGGYDKMAKPINSDAVTWTWDSVEEFGPDNGLYFVNPDDGFKDNNTIKVQLVTKDVSGTLETTAYIFANGLLKKKLPIGDTAGSFRGVAVRENYGLVQVSGVTNEDFTLVTQRDQVQLIGNLYVSGTEPILNTIASWSPTTQFAPSESALASLWAQMIDPKVKAHIAVVAGLDMTEDDANRLAPVFIDKKYSGLLFTTAAYISQFGELNCTATGNTSLRFYNVGPVMTLQMQTKLTGSSDTAQKWPKIYIQDQRYLREDEQLPPICGEDPGAHPNEDMEGLNRNHRWATSSYSKVDRWEYVVWRNGKPNF